MRLVLENARSYECASDVLLCSRFFLSEGDSAQTLKTAQKAIM